MTSRRGRGDAGQSTVELALALPFVFLLLLTLVQAGLLVRAQVMVTHAAREAARAGAVSDDAGRVEHAARGAADLDPRRLSVIQSGRGGPGSQLTVRVEYDQPVQVPLLATVWHGAHLSARATMRVEQ